MWAEPHRLGADWRDVIQTELVVVFRVPDIPYVDLLGGEVVLVRDQTPQEPFFGKFI